MRIYNSELVNLIATVMDTCVTTENNSVVKFLLWIYAEAMKYMALKECS
jgi:hypothetical protein